MPRALAVLALVLALAPACKGRKARSPDAGDGQSATAMGSWDAWLDLSPLLEVARSHAPERTVDALKKASKLLQDGKARSADGLLAPLADSDGRHWVAVARADLAALYFTTCIRGVAWRLEDLTAKSPPMRRSDFSENTKLIQGDVSVEAMLTDLDAAVSAKNAALAVQARIARARVTAFSSRCPATPDVQQLSEGILKNDLATLAAENHLTPDLAFLWAGVQMSEFSGAAARPFLLMARDGGYTDPSVVYMLGVIALEQRDLDRADGYASDALTQYAKIGDKDQQAQTLFLRGEVARARNDAAGARKHYESAQKIVPGHPAAVLGVARLVLAADGPSGAVKYLQGILPQVALTGPLTPEKTPVAADNLEALAMFVQESELVAVTRDALLAEVDLEPDVTRRGLRYFFAATLDARLGEYAHARAHAALARDEFATTSEPPPVDVDKFIERVDSVSNPR
ncbi:MAG: hypothetical protein JNL82_00370 [Myxococcales bacterium]|nr:hypothetical protein [Myxococcales bacterium]